MLIRLYYAASLDGYIADAAGGVGWLDEYDGRSYRYDAFMREIGIVVVGRATYDQALSFGPKPFGGKEVLVLTHRAVEARVRTTVATGEISTIARRLRAEQARDAWIMGGAHTMAEFLNADAVDRIDHFVIPVALGSGIPAFAGLRQPRSLALDDTERFADGVVRLSYVRPESGTADALAANP